MRLMDESDAPRVAPRRRGALVGLLVAAVALGVAHLVSAASAAWRSPVVTIGESVIDRVPPSVKTFAIRTFGANDKVALQIGTLVLLTLFAAVLGVLARRHPVVASAGVATFGLVGAASAVSRPGASWAAATPSVAGALAGVATLLVLRDRLLVASPAPPGDGASARADVGAERPGAFPRRQVLLTSLAAVGVATLAGGAGQALRRRFSVASSRAAISLPPAARPAGATSPSDTVGNGAITPFVTPNADFYRVDTALLVPQVAPESWRLRIHGLVDRKVELSYQDVLDRDLVERDLTLVCVSNEVGGQLAGTARWLGLPLAGLLEEAGVRPEASQLVSRSVDGWTCGTPTAALLDGRDALLAVGMNGEPLPLAHGFPARLVVPGLYGYVSGTKWVTDLELTTFEDFDAYWVKRGWAQQAPIKLFSRIDTPRGLAKLAAGPTAVGGVAWAPHTGIAGVEVRVDDGPWQAARLGDVPSADTWRQWLLPWDATPGRHTLTVRAIDAAGTTQSDERAEPIPDGATGWHSIVVLVS
jgi:DMSO/TMAO reductase YedYZ molybdopterin-dependent catalytic subunit